MSVRPGPRVANDQRYPGRLLEQASLLPQAVLAEVIAVIAGKDDDCAVGQAQTFQRSENAAELGVHERGRSVIGLDRVAPQAVVHLVLFRLGTAKGRKWHATAIVVATRSPERLDPGSITDRARAVAERVGRPAVLEFAGRLYEGEMKTSGVPVLTDAYSPTDALQHLAR